ncbi:MAG: hypothetical protein ACI93R_001884 [Flavobacteriales bacterium]|jgi:hypothetical protein
MKKITGPKTNAQTEQPLRDAIQQKIESEELNDNQLSALMQLQQLQAQKHSKTGNSTEKPMSEEAVQANASRYALINRPYAIRRSTYGFVALACCLFLAVGGFTRNYISLNQLDSRTQQVAHSAVMEVETEVAMEVALEAIGNHLKLKPLEVRSQNIRDVQNYFTQLDFNPINSNQLASNTNAGLIGARYCSIKGVTAAQLRYRESNQDIITFYEVAYDATLHGAIPDIAQNQSPLQLSVKGLNVILWVERDLLMVQVQR